jgi:flagellin
MIIQNNGTASSVYVPYADAISNLQQSAQRLATGKNFASAADGTGELGVADRMKLNIAGTNALIATMENASGYASTQDEILSHVADIVTRMSELAASAIDPTKTAADRAALNAELRSLDTEVAALASNSKYNGTALFDTTTTVRIGTEITDTIQFSAVSLGALTFVTVSLNNVTVASAALISLQGKAASLNILRNRSRSHNARVDRTVSFTQNYVANLSNAESKIRDVDIAKETGEFTTKQVLLQGAQSVLAQMNGISQQSLQFFQ